MKKCYLCGSENLEFFDFGELKCNGCGQIIEVPFSEQSIFDPYFE